MKHFILLIGFFLISEIVFADLQYNPITFSLRTDKESYYEGEKITFHITITNTSRTISYPVLIPHTQNTRQKLLRLNVYDKAKNTLLLRYTEDPMLNMLVRDTGTVQIKYLQPLEQIEIPIYLNDTDSEDRYLTNTASHHSLGVPLFAGIYQVNIAYTPNGIALGDSIYNYYHDTETEQPNNGKLSLPGNGDLSTFCTLKIKRSADTVVSIERQKYFIKTNGDMFYYFTKYMDQISTDKNCVHITSLLPDSSSSSTREYFYNQFPELYNEYISRFDDGDLREYRKFTNWCPSHLYTLKYNELKQKTNYELQLPDRRFYSVSYHQPSGNIQQETYCNEDGTQCEVSNFIYNNKGEFVRKTVQHTEPCSVVIIDGIKRSAKRVVNLGE